MSKIGISLVESYMGAQIFEALGVGQDLLELGFKGTPSRVRTHTYTHMHIRTNSAI
jgi:glutamate synthase (ferredoxin)